MGKDKPLPIARQDDTQTEMIMTPNGSSAMMPVNRLTIRRWCNSALLLTLIALSLIVPFALLYWGIDQLGFGTVITRQGDRETDFIALLYFSMGTFFRIGYGDQVPTGWNYLLVGLKALSSFLLEVIFLAQVVMATAERYFLQQIRAYLEDFPSVNLRRY